jgi:hypothetical protein
MLGASLARMSVPRIVLVVSGVMAAAPTASARPAPVGHDERHLPNAATDTAPMSQQELLAAAQRAERSLDPAAAIQLYARAEALDPGARLARLARRRLAWLEERSEGGYAPLIILLELRQGRLTRDRLAALEERVRELSPGIVRREALAIIGDEYAARGAERAALTAYESWLESPDLSEAERQLAHGKAALARAKLTGPEASLAALEQAELSHRAEATYLRAERMGRYGTPISLAVLALFLAAGIGLTRGRLKLDRVFSPARLALAGWLFAVPLLLVWWYDRLLVPQLALVLATLLGALLIAALFASGPLKPAARRILAPLAAAAVLSAAFLAADRSRLLFDILWSIEQSHR